MDNDESNANADTQTLSSPMFSPISPSGINNETFVYDNNHLSPDIPTESAPNFSTREDPDPSLITARSKNFFDFDEDEDDGTIAKNADGSNMNASSNPADQDLFKFAPSSTLSSATRPAKDVDGLLGLDFSTSNVKKDEPQ